MPTDRGAGERAARIYLMIEEYRRARHRRLLRRAVKLWRRAEDRQQRVHEVAPLRIH
jgi:hypothetical protein